MFDSILLVLISFSLGVLMFPFLLFLRARRDASWDNSNITNIYRVIAHVAVHPSDFSKMQYADGKKPFWYIGKDELTDIVDTRPDS